MLLLSTTFWHSLTSLALLDAVLLGAACAGVGVSTLKIALREGTLGIGDHIAGHLLIGAEIRSLQRTVGSDETGEDIGIQFMCVLIPEQFLAGKAQSVLGSHTHS